MVIVSIGLGVCKKIVHVYDRLC